MVLPSLSSSSQYLLSELDFRISVWPRSTTPYVKTNMAALNLLLFDSDSSALPSNEWRLTRSSAQSHRDTTVVGLVGGILRSFRGAMLLLSSLRASRRCSFLFTDGSSPFKFHKTGIKSYIPTDFRLHEGSNLYDVFKKKSALKIYWKLAKADGKH